MLPNLADDEGVCRPLERLVAPTDVFDTMATEHDLAGAQAALDRTNDLQEEINQE